MSSLFLFRKLKKWKKQFINSTTAKGCSVKLERLPQRVVDDAMRRLSSLTPPEPVDSSIPQWAEADVEMHVLPAALSPSSSTENVTRSPEVDLDRDIELQVNTIHWNISTPNP